jgi:hypothetical protein
MNPDPPAPPPPSLPPPDAISSIGGVLEHYDTDRRFPAFGFGAGLPPSGTVSHCFPLNGSPGSPEVAGVAGILQAYRHTLSTVRLSGPTLFAPIIGAAAQVWKPVLAWQPSMDTWAGTSAQSPLLCALSCAAGGAGAGRAPDAVLRAAHPHRRVHHGHAKHAGHPGERLRPAPLPAHCGGGQRRLRRHGGASCMLYSLPLLAGLLMDGDDHRHACPPAPTFIHPHLFIRPWTATSVASKRPTAVWLQETSCSSCHCGRTRWRILVVARDR